MQETLASRFPDADIRMNAPNHDTGVWFLDFLADSCQLTIQWQSGLGFGVSRFGSGCYGERPEEFFPALKPALDRILSLVASEQSSHPA